MSVRWNQWKTELTLNRIARSNQEGAGGYLGFSVIHMGEV